MTNINNYYSTLDTTVINNLCKNEDLKNLIHLSTLNDINVFTTLKYNKIKLKSKCILLKECDKIKKKEIKTTSNMLINLAKLNNITDLNDIKNTYKYLETKLTNIDNFIDCINKIDTINDYKNYIECYSNC
jgi:hypothetical protein